MKTQSPLVKLWAMPIALALLSTGGLISALLGDGFADALSWLALSVPIMVCIRCVLKTH
ncbi:hypothetical protein [Methylosoma difficile]